MRKIFTFLCAALMSVGMFADINLTITQKPTESYSPGDDWVELSMHSEEGVDVTLYLAGITEMALGTSYNLGDMDSWSKISISGTDYELSDALITKTMNDGLVRYAGFVADYNSNRYNFDYQEQPAPEPATTVVTITDSDFPAWGDSFTKDGVTVSAEMLDGMYGNISGPGSFSTTLGNFTKIEIFAEDVSTISGEGWSGDSEHKTWTGNASSVSFTGDINGNEEGTTLKFTIEAASTPEPAGEVTVVFAANNKTAERTVTLPHTFKCDWAGGMERPDELDIIIHELYNDYYYCNSNMNASGSDQVEAGTEEDPKNDYITIKGVFDGTATVTGDYLDYIAGDYGEHNYSITISIKGSEPAPTGVENVQTNQVQATKFFRDGMLLIEKNGKIYNVQGVEVR